MDRVPAFYAKVLSRQLFIFVIEIEFQDEVIYPIAQPDCWKIQLH